MLSAKLGARPCARSDARLLSLGLTMFASASALLSWLALAYPTAQRHKRRAEILVKVAFNKKAYQPPVSAIKDKFYEMFRGKGNLEEEIEQNAPAVEAEVAKAATASSSAADESA